MQPFVVPPACSPRPPLIRLNKAVLPPHRHFSDAPITLLRNYINAKIPVADAHFIPFCIFPSISPKPVSRPRPAVFIQQHWDGRLFTASAETCESCEGWVLVHKERYSTKQTGQPPVYHDLDSGGSRPIYSDVEKCVYYKFVELGSSLVSPFPSRGDSRTSTSITGIQVNITRNTIKTRKPNGHHEYHYSKEQCTSMTVSIISHDSPSNTSLSTTESLPTPPQPYLFIHPRIRDTPLLSEPNGPPPKLDLFVALYCPLQEKRWRYKHAKVQKRKRRYSCQPADFAADSALREADERAVALDAAVASTRDRADQTPTTPGNRGSSASPPAGSTTPSPHSRSESLDEQDSFVAKSIDGKGGRTSIQLFPLMPHLSTGDIETIATFVRADRQKKGLSPHPICTQHLRQFISSLLSVIFFLFGFWQESRRQRHGYDSQPIIRLENKQNG
ncbi:hypothetical protein BLNAU_25042 [Blattamonas nauphoetae]|uniref:Uncharacterized protein n=1 Tax=Blattamonas nauphoetae TaxID=2049346 RepID=A0ABQ9WL15_9EUKA|nr:hypothetical protein BLNAU_25042 [Blattamonas nauphoetae]